MYRMLLSQADKESEVSSTVSMLESRAARLAAELEEVSVALEVAKAKAGMYDELQAKAERLVRCQAWWCLHSWNATVVLCVVCLCRRVGKACGHASPDASR